MQHEHNSPAHSSIGTQSSKNGLLPFVGTWFQIYFTPLPGVLFTFPLRYWFAIGHKRYLAFTGDPACFERDSACLALLKLHEGDNTISSTGLSPSMVSLSREIPLLYCFVTPLGYLVARHVTYYPFPTLPLDRRLSRFPPRSRSQRSSQLEKFRLYPFRSPLLRI